MYSPFAKTALSGIKEKRKPRSAHSLSSSFYLSPGSPGSSFNQSFRNSIIFQSSNYSLELYGSCLPVLVTEAVRLERITDISVRLEPFGYASLVCGRQLLIWKYKCDGSDKSIVHCKELTLPPSDLAHKAELVHLFQTEDFKLPSALAVSPEGHVRYWPNINHEGSSVDAVAELQGQECYSLTSVFPLGCILATTTSSLVLITPTIGEGQPNVICRTLTLPMGVLTGIGRKVSSFIFGIVPTQTSESKQLNRVLAVRGDGNEYFVYVLSSNSLQKWHIIRKYNKENCDQLLFEVDLERQLKQKYVEEVYRKDASLMPNLNVWALDMQFYSSGVLILTAGTVMTQPDRNVHYAFAFLSTSSNQTPEQFSSFFVTQHCERYEEENEEQLLNYKFILPSAVSQCAFIYNSKKILCVQVGRQADLDEINFENSGNQILGSGTCDGSALFFTLSSGVVSVVMHQKGFGDSRFLTSIKDSPILQSEPSDISENLTNMLRGAVKSYCSGEMEKCETLMKEIVSKSSAQDMNLDDKVVSISLQIIDDYPVSDPRWCESVPSSCNSPSLMISYQLNDKLTAHECLISCLKATEIFDKLSTSKVGDLTVSTNVLLCEHAEKIVAAKAVRLFLADHHDVIETAIQFSLGRRNIEVKNHLTPQDVFFREVSAFHTIFPAFIEWESEELQDDESMSKILNIVMTVNKIFVALLDAIHEYRESKKDVFHLQRDSEIEFLPWTAREGDTGIRTYIRNQLNVNLSHTLKASDSVQIQGVLYQQYVDILDFYLSSYKSQLNSLRPERQASLKKEYGKQRSQYIKPLLEIGQYERAAAVAEKYLDFDILIQICEDTQSSDRMQRYMLQFSEQKFSEYVFRWYLNKGQRGKIFDRHLGQREELGNFLQSHDTLKWLHYIQEEQYEAAYATLKELALKETEFLNKKKTLLSVGKLVAMISNAPEDTKQMQIESINVEQDLIIHQETLPISTVEAYGLDPKNMRVFHPEELIEMYISDENPAANAYDFKIALDILSFIKKPITDPEVNNLRMHIWSKAVLKDNWDELDIKNPLEAIKETVFFQIIELAFNQDADMHAFIPPIEDLLEYPELKHLSDNPSFKYLIQVGYEYVLKSID